MDSVLKHNGFVELKEEELSEVEGGVLPALLPWIIRGGIAIVTTIALGHFSKGCSRALEEGNKSCSN